jgi:site-specific DNA recombinase
MRACIYTRVSTDEQGKGYGLPTQLAACREYAAAHGYTVVAEHSDEATGTTLDRPGLEAVRRLAESKGCDVVVVYESSRLARRLVLVLLLEDELQRRGAPVEYVMEPTEATPEGQFMSQVRGAVAELERAKILERMSRGKRGRVQAGHVMPGIHAPYGYRYVRTDHGGQFEIEDGEAEIVRQIYRWYVEGDETGRKLGAYAIAKRLTAARVPTRMDIDGRVGKRSLGACQWNASSVMLILRSETYAGLWHWNRRRRTSATTTAKREPGDWYSVEVPAIVSREVWEAAGRQAQANNKRALRNTRHTYTLRLRLTCGNCRGSYTGEYRKGRRYYRCAGTIAQRSLSYTTRCHGLLRSDRIEPAVWGRVVEVLTVPGLLAALAQANTDDAARDAAHKRQAQVEADIAALDREQARLYDAYITLGTMERDEYQRRMSDLQRRRGAADDERRQLVRQTTGSTRGAASLTERMAALDYDLRHAMPEQQQAMYDVLDLHATVGADKTSASITITIDGQVIPLGDVVLP